MTSQRYICVAAIARTGTSHLRRVMGRLPGLVPYGEIFNRHRAMTVAEEDVAGFSARVGLQFPGGQRDINLISAAHAHPEALLDVIWKRRGLTSFKLFPSHLDREDVQRLLSRPDLTLICLRRRPIDCYISSRKAAAAGGDGSTGARIELKFGHFRRWFESHREWYAFVTETAALAGKPVVSLSYEDDIRQPEAVLLARLMDRLAAVGVSLNAPPGREEPAAPGPGQAEDCTAGTVNWDEFSEKLRAGGLYEAAFAPFPLAAE